MLELPDSHNTIAYRNPVSIYTHQLPAATSADHTLVTGSLSSNPHGEVDIRRALIEADLVGSMVALPAYSSTTRRFSPVSGSANDARLFGGETELSLVA